MVGIPAGRAFMLRRTPVSFIVSYERGSRQRRSRGAGAGVTRGRYRQALQAGVTDKRNKGDRREE